jgi:hypothetical protein
MKPFSGADLYDAHGQKEHRPRHGRLDGLVLRLLHPFLLDLFLSPQNTLGDDSPKYRRKLRPQRSSNGKARLWSIPALALK